MPFCVPCDKEDEKKWERIAGLIREAPRDAPGNTGLVGVPPL
jgi:hypothetical protein